MKAALMVQMEDLDEWEVLPPAAAAADDGGFAEINSSSNSNSNSSSVLEMNYFICPPTPTPPEINNISTRGGGGGGDQDLNEFVDMMDSSNNIPQSQPQLELDDDDINKMELQSAHNVWKRGIAAICSFAAAAAFCIILSNNTHPPNQNFAFHTRVPISRARITCRGYYDAAAAAAAAASP